MEYVLEAPIDDNRSGPKVSVDENKDMSHEAEVEDTIPSTDNLEPKEKETTDGYVQETQKTSSMEYVLEAPIDDNRSGPKVSVDENKDMSSYNVEVVKLLKVIEHTRDPSVIQECLRSSLKFKSSALAIKTLARIHSIIASVAGSRPDAFDVVVSQLFPDFRSICYVMGEFSGIYAVQHHGVELCESILMSASSLDCSEQMANAGVLTSMTNVLVKSANDVELCIRAAKCLCHIILKAPDCKFRIPIAPFCSSLDELLHQHSGNPAFCTQISQLVVVMSADSHAVISAMGEAGIGGGLMRCLQACMENEVASIHLSRAVLGLISHGHDANRERIGTSENFSIAIAALRRNRSDVAAFKQIGLLIIGIGGNRSDILRRIPIEQFVQTIGEVFSEDPPARKVLKSAVTIVYCVAVCQSLRKPMIDNGLLTQLEKLEYKIPSKSFCKASRAARARVAGENTDMIMRINSSASSVSEFDSDSEKKIVSPRSLGKLQSLSEIRAENSSRSLVDVEEKECASSPVHGSVNNDDKINRQQSATSPLNDIFSSIMPIKDLSPDEERKLRIDIGKTSKNVNKEEALKTIQNAVQHFLIKKRNKKFARTAGIRLATFLQSVENTSNDEILIEAMKTALEVSSTELALKAMKRIEVCIKEAKRAQKHSPVAAELIRHPTVLLSFLRGFINDGEVQRYGVKVLTGLTYASGGNDILGKAGTFPFLYFLLGKFIENEDVCRMGIELAIRLTAKSVSNRLRAGRRNGFSFVINVLKSHIDNVIIVERSCRYICGCIDSVPQNQDLFRDAGGCEILLQLFMKHCDKIASINHISMTIINLCSQNNVKNQEFFASEDYVSMYLNVLVKSSTNDKIYKSMCMMVFGLLTFPDVSVPQLAKCDLPAKIISILESKMSLPVEETKDVVRSTAILLQSVCSHDTLREQFARTSIVDILTSLKSSDYDKSTRRNTEVAINRIKGKDKDLRSSSELRSESITNRRTLVKNSESTELV